MRCLVTYVRNLRPGGNSCVTNTSKVKEQGIAPVCSRCFRTRKYIRIHTDYIYVHQICSKLLQEYCVTASSFDEMLRSAIAARPMQQPVHNLPKLMRESLHNQDCQPALEFWLTRRMVENLKRLPLVVLEEICSYLDLEPFPELVALIQSSLNSAVYSKRGRPRWTHGIEVKSGATLFMSFKAWNEQSYLTCLDSVRPRTGQTQVLRVEDALIVCRDHFGIRGLYARSDDIGERDPSLFFCTLPLRPSDRKLLKLRGFFDVSAFEIFHSWLSISRGYFFAHWSKNLLPAQLSNGTCQPCPQKRSGFHHQTHRNTEVHFVDTPAMT